MVLLIKLSKLSIYLFMILDDLLCKVESLNKYNTFSQLRKIESTTWFKSRGFL